MKTMIHFSNYIDEQNIESLFLELQKYIEEKTMDERSTKSESENEVTLNDGVISFPYFKWFLLQY